MTQELQEKRKIPAFGFKSCGTRKYCAGCEFFTEGDPWKDKICNCPENVDIPDDEANALIAAFATAALDVVRENLQVVKHLLEERDGKRPE